MAPPQDSSNHTRLVKRRRYSADGASSSRASSSALLEPGELVGDTQTNDAVSEMYSVLEEPRPQREPPRAPLQAEGRPPTPLQAEGRPPTPLQAEGRPPTPLQTEGRPPTALQAEGRPPTEAKWNFNLESDTPGALLPLPPVAADVIILEGLPSEEPGVFPEVLFRIMEKCIKGHRQDVVG